LNKEELFNVPKMEQKHYETTYSAYAFNENKNYKFNDRTIMTKLI